MTSADIDLLERLLDKKAEHRFGYHENHGRSQSYDWAEGDIRF